MADDDLDLYDDLVEFQQVEERKCKELEAWENKYKQAQEDNEALRLENKALIKKVKTIEVNFQNLLDTAKAEVKRLEKQIAELRKEKDDICFRRKRSKFVENNFANNQQQLHHVDNMPRLFGTVHSASNEQQQHHININEQQPSVLPAAVLPIADAQKVAVPSKNEKAETQAAREQSVRRHETHERAREREHVRSHERDRQRERERERYHERGYKRDDRARHSSRQDSKNRRRDADYGHTHERIRDSKRDEQEQRGSSGDQRDKHSKAEKNVGRGKRSDRHSRSEQDDSDHNRHTECRDEVNSLAQSTKQSKLRPASCEKAVEPSIKFSEAVSHTVARSCTELIAKRSSTPTANSVELKSVNNNFGKEATNINKEKVRSKTIDGILESQIDAATSNTNTTEAPTTSRKAAESLLTTPKKIALFNDLFGETPSRDSSDAKAILDGKQQNFLENVLNILSNDNALAQRPQHATRPAVPASEQSVTNTECSKTVAAENIHAVENAAADCIMIPGLDLINVQRSYVAEHVVEPTNLMDEALFINVSDNVEFETAVKNVAMAKDNKNKDVNSEALPAAVTEMHAKQRKPKKTTGKTEERIKNRDSEKQIKKEKRKNSPNATPQTQELTLNFEHLQEKLVQAATNKTVKTSSRPAAHVKETSAEQVESEEHATNCAETLIDMAAQEVANKTAHRAQREHTAQPEKTTSQVAQNSKEQKLATANRTAAQLAADVTKAAESTAEATPSTTFNMCDYSAPSEKQEDDTTKIVRGNNSETAEPNVEQTKEMLLAATSKANVDKLPNKETVQAKKQIQILENIRLPTVFAIEDINTNADTVLREANELDKDVSMPQLIMEDDESLANDSLIIQSSAPITALQQSEQQQEANENHAAENASVTNVNAPHDSALGNFLTMPNISADAIEQALQALHDTSMSSVTPKKRYAREATAKMTSPAISPLKNNEGSSSSLLHILGDSKGDSNSENALSKSHSGGPPEESFVCKLGKIKAAKLNKSSPESIVKHHSELATTEHTTDVESISLHNTSTPKLLRRKTVAALLPGMVEPEEREESLHAGKVTQRRQSIAAEQMVSPVRKPAAALMSADLKNFRIPKLKKSQTVQVDELKTAAAADEAEAHATHENMPMDKESNMGDAQGSMDAGEQTELTLDAGTASQATQVKRGRGRPRKHPIVTDAAVLEKVSREPKKRGRKKREQATHEEQQLMANMDQSLINNSATSSDILDVTSSTEMLEEELEKKAAHEVNEPMLRHTPISEPDPETEPEPAICKRSALLASTPEDKNRPMATANCLERFSPERVKPPAAKRFKLTAELSSSEEQPTSSANVVNESASSSASACENSGMTNVTIDETAITSAAADTSNVLLHSNSTLNASSGSSIVTKCVSLGATDYRFEQMPNNVVKLVVTRRGRKRKQPIAAPAATNSKEMTPATITDLHTTEAKRSPAAC